MKLITIIALLVAPFVHSAFGSHVSLFVPVNLKALSSNKATKADAIDIACFSNRPYGSKVAIDLDVVMGCFSYYYLADMDTVESALFQFAKDHNLEMSEVSTSKSDGSIKSFKLIAPKRNLIAYLKYSSEFVTELEVLDSNTNFANKSLVWTPAHLLAALVPESSLLKEIRANISGLVLAAPKRTGEYTHVTYEAPFALSAEEIKNRLLADESLGFKVEVRESEVSAFASVISIQKDNYSLRLLVSSPEGDSTKLVLFSELENLKSWNAALPETTGIFVNRLRPSA